MEIGVTRQTLARPRRPQSSRVSGNRGRFQAAPNPRTPARERPDRALLAGRRPLLQDTRCSLLSWLKWTFRISRHLLSFVCFSPETGIWT